MQKKLLQPTTNQFNQLTTGRYGYIFYNENDRYIGHAIEKYGEYGEHEVFLYKQICRTNDVVVEVGANIGAHTIALSQLVGEQGRVYAFEPQRIVFQTLCATMAANSITNVEAFPMAAGNASGFLKVPELDYRKLNNYGGISVENHKSGTRVAVTRLDEFLELDALRLLKIDVEGMEIDVIKGASGLIEKFEPILYVENDRREKSKALIELISALDYKMYWHLPKLFNKDNYAGDSENIFGNMVSVNLLCLPTSSKTEIRDMQEVTDSDFHPMYK